MDLHRKLANHKTLHFRPFLAKNNDSIFRKNPKTLFLGLFGSLLLPNFAPIFRGDGVEIEKNCPQQSESTFHQLFKYEIRFSKSLAVVLDIGILHKSPKTLFLPFFGPFFALNLENENFSRYGICTES